MKNKMKRYVAANIVFHNTVYKSDFLTLTVHSLAYFRAKFFSMYIIISLLHNNSQCGNWYWHATGIINILLISI